MDILFEAKYYVFHIAILLIAVVLLSTLVYEMRKPKKNPNDDPDTKRMNDMLKD